MSLFMVVEGSQVWIRIAVQVYTLLQQQVHAQGYKVMLLVSSNLHNNMQGWRHLRGFYVFGGSCHDTPISTNVVRLICIIANTMHNQSPEEDDEADADSPVNQHLNSKNTRLVALSLLVLENDTTGSVS